MENHVLRKAPLLAPGSIHVMYMNFQDKRHANDEVHEKWEMAIN